MPAAAEIVFDRVTKRYPGRDAAALDDLSFEIPAGTFCVLVGPSGGGKTTALKLVNRLIPFDTGDIRIDGRSILDLPLVELRRGIGYVIQQVGLFPHMTIGDNIATVPRLLHWPKQKTAQRVAELLELVGLEQDDAKRYPAQLSGGQRQRVGLARALAADPPLLLMDEPFGALDPITRARRQQELRRLHREVEKTVIFVTHDVDEAILMGDRIAILHEGGVLAQYDTPDAILAHPADEFVERFIGEDRALRRLALRRLGDVPLDPPPDAAATWPTVASARSTVRNAVSLMLEAGTEQLLVVDDDGDALGTLLLSRAPRSSCADDRRRPRDPELRPRQLLRDRRPPLLLGLGARALGRHARAEPRRARQADPDRRGDRLRACVRARACSHTACAASTSRSAIAAALIYTIPSVAIFQILVPFFGLTDTTIEIPLVGYSLVILYPNIVAGLRAAPPEVLDAARGMGLRRSQTLLRVELPLAVPAIIGGLRIAVVSTVSIATIAALIGGKGLGQPIFIALQDPTPFKTEIYSAGALVVALALSCDLVLVIVRRMLVRWAR